MKTEKTLKKYSEKRVTVIESLLQKPVQKYTSVTFHKLRVEIKKLNALFELVSYCSKDFKRKKTFKPFKSIFRQAGKVRELQLEEAMLKKYNFQSSLKDYENSLKTQRLGEQKDFFSAANKKSSDKLQKRYERLVPFFKYTGKKKVNDYMQKKQKEIETLLAQKVLQTEQIHELRKGLKNFYYNRKSLALPEQNAQPAEEDILPELLGNWHDNQVIIRHFTKAIDANGMKPQQASRLEIIKAKLSSENKTLLTKIHAALPSSELYNQTQKA